MGDKAWTAQELADRLGMHIMTLRRYLRFAANSGVLIEKRYGRYKYYCHCKCWERFQQAQQRKDSSET